LLLVNDLKGISARGVLRPAAEGRGASELYVKVDYKLYDFSTKVDNRGSKYTGTMMGTISAGLNSMLGLGEHLSVTSKVSTSDPRELKSIDLTYGMPLGDRGLNVTIAGGFSYSIPGFTLRDLSVRTNTAYGEFDLSYPFIRTREETLTGSLGYTHRDTTVEMLGERFSRDRLRMGRAAMGYTNRGFLGGVTALNLDMTQGLPVFDATDPDAGTMSRADAKTSFTKFGLSFAHARQLFYGVGVLLSATAQYSMDPLPSSEEYTVGGASFGRPYDEGEISGEHGAAVSIELSRVFRFENPYISSVRPYWFYDFGVAWDDQTESSAGGRSSLASSGFGVSADFIYGLKMSAEFARPLTRVPVTTSKLHDGDRYSFSLGVDF
ncbi:MAG: BamA/TamA family outer membrane protein, partial [Rhodospirillales bacterium]|nr:BamA/TamA family outer membrane protein [Rhodospirillales bacterium]